jgi:hypothetical protein
MRDRRLPRAVRSASAVQPAPSPSSYPTSRGLALANAGDEVVLRNADGAVVDAVTYGAGAFSGVVPHPGEINVGHSLERRPPEEDTDDCSRDFFDRFPPTPGVLPD